MNRKQIIVLWVGIIAFVYLGLTCRISGRGWTLEMESCVKDIAQLLVYWVVTAVVTGGLIYTFRDKKDKKPKDEQKQ